MTPSTRLLFRLIKFRIYIGAGLAFCLFLFLPFVDPPLDPEYRLLIPFIAMAFTLAMGLHGFLTGTMFPVTDKQVAWIPMSVWAFITAAGTAGLVSGQVLSIFGGTYVSGAALLHYWIGAFAIWPAVIFALLIFWRLLRLNPAFLGFGYAVAIMANNKLSVMGAWITGSWVSMWPLWITASGWLIYEAPLLTHVLRKMDYRYTQVGFISVPAQQPYNPVMYNWPVRVTSVLLAAFGLAVLLFTSESWSAAYYEQVERNPVVLLLSVILLVLPVLTINTLWKAIRASGIASGRAFLTLLVELTGVGYLLRDLMGVQSGTVTTCGACNNYRFVWQSVCPHCSDASMAAAQKGKAASLFMANIFIKHDPAANLFRRIVPMQIVILAVLLHWLKLRH